MGVGSKGGWGSGESKSETETGRLTPVPETGRRGMADDDDDDGSAATGDSTRPYPISPTDMRSRSLAMRSLSSTRIGGSDGESEYRAFLAGRWSRWA